MESTRFDDLVRAFSNPASRRAILKGLAATAGGAGFAFFGAAPNGDFGAEAKKCGDKKCKKPNNPCKKAVCKNQKCRKKDKPNGTGCGNGLVCFNGQCVGDCASDGDECAAGTDCCSDVCTCGTNDEAGLCQGNFGQGFEQDASGWIGVARVPSGTDGINAKSGDFFGKVTGPASSSTGFTRWGGYASAFPNDGYETQITIWINPADIADTEQFDYSSAINLPNCDHRRDFIFTAGKVGANYCVTASNNSPGDPCNPQREPQILTEAGWYIFRHEFKNVSGILSVDLTLIDPAGDDVHTWTLSDPSDVIDETVGGNRYGWFSNIEQDFVAIEDTSRVS